jgi:predicted nucleic acid-binding protein
VISHAIALASDHQAIAIDHRLLRQVLGTTCIA